MMIYSQDIVGILFIYVFAKDCNYLFFDGKL